MKSISLLFFLTTLVDISNSEEYLVQKRDFDFFLNSLENLIDFYTNHVIFMRLNAKFGIFMVDMNLRTYLEDEEHYDIPKSIRYKMKTILLKIEVLTGYFHYKTNKMKRREYTRAIKYSEQFYNRTTWSITPDKFHLLADMQFYSPEHLEKIYGKWEDYVKKVEKPIDGTSFKESHKCMESMAKNSLPNSSKSTISSKSSISSNSSNSSTSSICKIPKKCQEWVKGGTEFGYGLAQRLLYLMTARFSRLCNVFSKETDRLKTVEICAKYLRENQYIAINGYRMPVVLSHHCGLCGILGHARFIRRSWLKRLTQFQTSKGCFYVNDNLYNPNLKVNYIKEGNWLITSPQIMMLNNQCHAGFTEASLLTQSNAVRYIIETYYSVVINDSDLFYDYI